MKNKQKYLNPIFVSAFADIYANIRFKVQFVKVDSELPLARMSTGKILAA